MIVALIEDPDGAWTTTDICGRVYAGANRIEKKHRVAVSRGLRTISLPENWWVERLERQGSEHLLYNRLSIESQITKRWLSGFQMHPRDKFMKHWSHHVDKAHEDVDEYRRYFDADELGRIKIQVADKQKAAGLIRAFGASSSFSVEYLRQVGAEIASLLERKAALEEAARLSVSAPSECATGNTYHHDERAA
ncbi:hypothetical protein DPM33_15095 [Mesorhizobium hawassense]|uniref:Uncharacterized protein n=1 Tax=Mesorhizobium hawassense TaxID=1209954 RepID=A0A330HRD9_9HYPH|nr:hypothetical protein DPM33_15095 [Mesorhizobium hawassense]